MSDLEAEPPDGQDFESDPAGSNKAVVVLRWIAFIPGGIIAGLVSYVLVVVLNRLSLEAAGKDPDSWLGLLWVQGVAHAVLTGDNGYEATDNDYLKAA